MTSDPMHIHTSPRTSLTNREDDLLLLSPDNHQTQLEISAAPSHQMKSSRGPEKVNPLLAFDPLLQMGDMKKSNERTGVSGMSGVWTGSDFDHPLFTNNNANGNKTPHNNAKEPTSTALPPRIKSKRGHRSHTSLGSAEMTGLFKSRPRGHTVATGDSLDELRLLATTSLTIDASAKEKPKKNHRKSNSIASMSELVASFGGGGKGGGEKSGETKKNARKSNSIGGMSEFVAALGGKGGGISTPTTPQLSPVRPKKALSPHRMLNRSSPATKPGIAPTPAGTGGMQLPLLAKPSPTSLLLEGDDLALRTSEQEPATHQVEIPSVTEMAIHAKLCAAMGSYRNIDATFSMSSLVNVSNLTLREFAFFGKTNMETAGLLEKHRPIVKGLLECAEGITVESYTASENCEVAIFDLPKLSQVVGVFRGSDGRQVKPVSSKKTRQDTSPNELHPDQKVTVIPVFRDAYFEVEPRFYTCLDKLTDSNPFAKIVLCGHSFGAALATLAAMRYANYRPTVMVSAHVFGSPKVGAANFRQLTNSIANLKVIRVENKDDPVVNTPIDAPHKKWEHVGHTISVGNKSGNVTAYRFDHNKPVSSASAPLFRKVERDSKAYAAALENCIANKKWVQDFAGEDVGDGVLGEDQEKRLMV